MQNDYTQMWTDLGLDLQAHDQLLEVLGQGYEQVFMSQANRPEGMAYFDFVMSEVHGLRIKELMDAKAEGRKVVGSFCVFVPEEIVLAVDGILVGLCTGADFATEEVDKILPRNTCALIKSAFGFKLGKVCPYLESADLIVGENTCDGKKKSYETLAGLVPALYVMDLPQTKSLRARELMQAEMKRFFHKMEEISGVTIDAARLKKGIQLVTEKRKALHRLNELRKNDPAPISGLDALLINQVQFYDDPVRFTASLNKLCDELETRVAEGKGAFAKGTPRVMVSGCPMAVPNWKLPMIIESTGAVIVGEESCVGERGTRNLVSDGEESLDELMEALVDRYFKIDCAIFTPNPERLDHVKEMTGRYNAQGVIHYSLQFCQPYQTESIPLEKSLENEKIKTLRLETDYSQEDIEQLRTRVEAFVEMIA
ncbi:double-cubane-cluster-containing anaerobic reductase [Dethiosulfatarculus sandiegensis]|uniref:3-hydroxyacyl-ACP dehydratase n=1 Tax=Dethiosulfatarculus sandiegensis TaxID=1429043 RepID=A0A0D2GCG1_9BACT|nr:double-cubane-cluster-containing anaerobic reductase [Dethiosulfatarculus sandiegensis]KIX12592.1 3-hydroxyacyl-ACP dehydratase [Dethiosulfatarculus sandiegensis]